MKNKTDDITSKLRQFSPETIQIMRDRGPEMFLLLVELWRDATKGGGNYNLIFEKAKLLLTEISSPIPNV